MNLLSRNRHWRRLRSVQSEGFYRASDRILLWSRILQTAPVHTEPLSETAQVEIHVLTYDRDYLSAMWALKSFYHFARVSYPLVIHLQGKVSRRIVTRLRHHFPASRIIEQAEADLHTELWLQERGYRRLLEARRVGIMMMKLVDFIVSCRASRLLAIDSDVLFFRRPEALIVIGQQTHELDLFMHDAASSYSISEAQASDELGIQLAPKVNCGLMLLPRDERRLKRCDDYLAHPDVARMNGLTEQTLHALYASECGRVGYLPNTYYVSPGSTEIKLSDLICRHYAGASRRLLTDEGMPALIKSGFLEELKSGTMTQAG